MPFKFTGKIDKLTIAIDRPKLTPEDVKKLKEAEAKAADGNKGWSLESLGGGGYYDHEDLRNISFSGLSSLCNWRRPQR